MNKKSILIDALFLLVLVIFSYIFSFHTKLFTLFDGDVGGYWEIIAGNAKTLMNGEFPLWHPYLWGGFSNAGSIFECFYLPFLPLYYLCWDPELQTLSFSFIGAVLFQCLIVFSWGLYALNKKISKNAIASFAGAALATFSGVTLSNAHWEYIFIGFSWMPLFILACSKAVEDERRSFRWIFIASVILSLIATGSTSHGLIFTAIIMFVLFLSYVIVDKDRFFYCFKKFFVIGTIGILLGGVQIFPFIKFMGKAFRYIPSASGTLDYSVFMEYTIPVTDLHQMLGQHFGRYAMSLLLCIGIVYSFKLHEHNKEFLLFGKILFVTALCMVSGAILPDLMWHVPLVKQIRELILWTPYIGISASVLLNCCIYEHSKGTIKKFDAVDFLVIILAVISFVPENNVDHKELLIKVISVLLLVAIFISFENKYKKWITTVLACIIVIFDFYELTVVHNMINTYSVSEATVKTELVTRNAQEEFGKLQNDGKTLSVGATSYSSNIPAAIGGNDCFAYMNPVYTKNWNLHFMDYQTRQYVQDLRYLFVSEENGQEFVDNFDNNSGMSRVAELNLYNSLDANETSKVYVYETDALGNAWMVDKYETYEDDNTTEAKDEIFGRLSKTDIRSMCLINIKTINDDIVLNTGKGNSTVDLLEYNANSIKYSCSSENPAILVTSEVLYPGWEVYVDGKKVNIMEANYAFRAVYVNSGDHIVEFRYLPKDVIFGFAISVITFVLALLFLIRQECILAKDSNA